MTDQTDRIKQMAQEAGIVNDMSALDNMPTLLESLAEFAALVAEDCASVVGYTYDAESIRARYAIAKPPEDG